MTDLALVKSTTALTFEPQSFADLMQFAELMARSEMVPKDYRGKPANIVSSVIAGREIGLSSYQSLQSIANINGRAVLWGDGMLGLIQGNPLCREIEEWLEGEGDERVAYCKTQRRGRVNPRTEKFSVTDAKAAGLWGKEGPWRNYPERMLKMRARGFCLRDEYPDVLKGISMAEEVMDIEPVNVTPEPAGDTRTEQIRNRLADMPGAQPEGVLEPPAPNFSTMLSAQIGESLEDAAQIKGLSADAYRALVIATLAGKKLSRTTAPAVWKAIQNWVTPEQPEPDAPADDAPITGAEEPALF